MDDIGSLSIAELKKKIQEKEKSLKSNFKNPIDKFTKIDDLLRENIILQRDLIEEQHISNKLLLALYYKQEKDGFIAPYQSNGINSEAILKGLQGGDDYQTLNPISYNISGKDAIIEIKGSGIIDTIKLVSNNTTTDNKSYSIEITCDKSILYKNTFAELEARAGTERGMVCYEDLIKNLYVLIFRTILYTNGFKIKVINSKTTTKFTLFQVKYHKKV